LLTAEPVRREDFMKFDGMLAVRIDEQIIEVVKKT
jgi:hypothetical protein